MPIHNLDKIFAPHRIAVIGASDRRTSVGYSVLRNLIGTGFEGVVYPVNNKREAVQGIPAYADIASLPHCPDLAIVCTPAQSVPEIVRECGRAGVGGMIILSAGFRETGAEGADLQDQILAAKQEYDLRIIGPNCLGIIAPHRSLNASFAASMPAAGRVALISQSGALCTSILDWAKKENIGFSHFVSVGNMLDVGVADLIDYFAIDPQTESIILYVESITGARAFLSAARAFTRTKPIVAYKSGRFEQSAKAAASHTGAMAGADDVYDAAFRRAGIERTFEIDELFDTAELLARHAPPRGPRLAIITNAGGPGVIATDALIARHGVLAELSSEVISQLGACLPACWSGGNPVDILGDATAGRFTDALRPVLSDDHVDAVLVILTPQAMTDPEGIAKAVGEVAKNSRKPVIATWMGGASVESGIEILQAAGVASYPSPEHAVRAFMHLVSYGRNHELLYETPQEVPVDLPTETVGADGSSVSSSPGLWQPPRVGLVSRFLRHRSFRGQVLLSEQDSKSILSRYGIPTTQTLTATSARMAVRQAGELGYPVVLKVLSPDITHKTDVGGVLLNLRHDEDVRRGYEEIVGNAKRLVPAAQVTGVTVQPMFDRDHGVELILGAKQDATFGAVILVGTGGTAAECFGDRALGLPPLNERLAYRMLESLRSWPLLEGYRGRPGVNLQQLIRTLIHFSYLVAESPEIQEFDINPLVVTPDEVMALDARAVVDHDAAERSVRPYEHLAIRPYPEQYVRPSRLKDGRPILLRPIRPEDEPMWRAMADACSDDSIRSRFRFLLRRATHALAARFCFIDYDREMAIVAEIKEHGERKIIGVGRLVAEPDHETAEFAALVADPWQECGLGSILTNYCAGIAFSWGLKRIVAETDWDNRRMLATFRRHGFEETKRTDGIVHVERVLTAARDAANS
ncbi:MAG: GNAT family N-acetyltransferase [Fuerstiella sp.]